MRFWLITLLLVLGGCSQTPAPVGNADTNTASASSEVQQLLKRQYSAWAGVPYRLGGTTKRGVDCSALVQITYRDHFGLALPRVTNDQANAGVKVSRNQLKTGDLVFFKTGTRTRHVGMMIDDVRFLHASTSQGVILSRLDNPYWSRHYWQARRLM
ncbi:C40 family peptidase [Marinobacter hydrocarbonoclasticus]|nr:C40 family peptidase [Marinobacter nauticus]